MIVKGTLTYSRSLFFLSVWILCFTLASCDIEPSKTQSLDELHAIFEKWCSSTTFTHISRQGTFHEDASGRHRFYRCIAELKNLQSCQLPETISFNTSNQDEQLIIGEGTYQLTLFLDYIKDVDRWKLQKIIIQSISAKTK